VGVAFGQHLYDTSPVPNYHKVIGWVVWALVTVQLSAFIIRPPLVRCCSVNCTLVAIDD
jgi:hypothetical protein